MYGGNVLHVGSEEIPLQEVGSCSLAQLTYHAVLDTTVSYPLITPVVCTPNKVAGLHR